MHRHIIGKPAIAPPPIPSPSAHDLDPKLPAASRQPFTHQGISKRPGSFTARQPSVPLVTSLDNTSNP